MTSSARIVETNLDNHDVMLVVEGAWHNIVWPAAMALPEPGDLIAWPIVDLPRLIGGVVEGKWSVSDGLYWHQPIAGGLRSRLCILKDRHKIMRIIRDYLDGQDFLELESPLLVHGTTPDLALNSFALGDRYLVTSTEYQIKRLIAGGAARVYTLTKNFREDAVSPCHNPEFSMLEWARVDVDLDMIENDVEEFTGRAAEILNGHRVLYRDGRTIDLTAPWPCRTIRSVIEDLTGIDPDDFSAARLYQATQAIDLEIRPEMAGDAVFLFTVLLDRAEKILGWDKPVFLRDWPSFLTSSAQEKSAGISDRSELIIAGVEIADGFPSLTDAARQCATFAREQHHRAAEGLPVVALDERYLTAMDLGLPKVAGMALGLDRLVMVLLDQPDIQAVMAFHWGNV
jgi:elongation factor P--beta-lysine ligase